MMRISNPFKSETLKNVFGMPKKERQAFARRAMRSSKLFTVFSWVFVPLILPFLFLGATVGELLGFPEFGAHAGALSGVLILTLITMIWLESLCESQFRRERLDQTDQP
jgi:hypothetical protein